MAGVLTPDFEHQKRTLYPLRYAPPKNPMFVAKFFRKEHKLGSYKGKTILEAKRPLLIFSLDVEFYLAFHVEGKKTLLVFFDITLRAPFRL